MTITNTHEYSQKIYDRAMLWYYQNILNEIYQAIIILISVNQ